MQDNVIEELPEGLGGLELVHLNVSVNCLRELPKDITTCRNLQYLLVNHNQVGIDMHCITATVDFANRKYCFQISCLPLSESTQWDLSGMVSLAYIDLRGNPVLEDPNYKEHFQVHNEIY